MNKNVVEGTKSHIESLHYRFLSGVMKLTEVIINVTSW